jgi:hypothetical protein
VCRGHNWRSCSHSFFSQNCSYNLKIYWMFIIKLISQRKSRKSIHKLFYSKVTIVTILVCYISDFYSYRYIILLHFNHNIKCFHFLLFSLILVMIIFSFLIYCCAGLGYIVTLTNVLKIYQIYYSWIHPPPHYSSLFSFPPFLE